MVSNQNVGQFFECYGEQRVKIIMLGFITTASFFVNNA